MNHWLVKQEPDSYAWDTFVADKRTTWDGVRNFQARNNMRAMKKGDLAFFYHSVGEKACVGIVKVVAEAHPDSTDGTGQWECVDVAARRPRDSTASPFTRTPHHLVIRHPVSRCSCANTTSCTRSRSDSLASTRLTCVFTVFSETFRARAISR